jgi:hypothetical protein
MQGGGSGVVTNGIDAGSDGPTHRFDGELPVAPAEWPPDTGATRPMLRIADSRRRPDD